MAIAKPLGLRLFIEGFEIPVIAAQVSIGVNSPAAASIQVVPVDEVMDLRPRSMVHLFFLDTEIQESTATVGSTNAPPVKTGTRNTYKLLFAGENVAFSWSQSPQSRSVVLQCLDFSNYWDSAHASAIEYGPGGDPFHDSAAITSGAPGLFDDLVDQQPNKLVEWLKGKPITPGLQSVSGLAGGIIRTLEAISGIPGYHRGINDFFTFGELRGRILAQITAEENDETAKRLLDNQVMDQWIMNGLQNMGRTVTFRQMMNLLFRYIYYESVSNPAAMWVGSYQGKTERKESGSYPLNGVPAGAAALHNLEEASNRLLLDFTPASADWTRKTSGIVEIALKDLDDAKKNLSRVSADKAELKSDLVLVQSKLDKAIALLKALQNVSIPSADSFKGPKSAVDEVIEAINTTKGQYKSYNIQTTSRTQRLHSHIFRPDCWFAAPPRCNVIFPEYYTQFQYERNLIGDVTRSLVQFGLKLVGPDSILDNYVLFPNAIMADGQSGYKNEGSYRVLMPHEVHSGIIPRTEWMPDTHTVNSSGDSDKAKKAKRIELSWAQRAGLFNFFKYRFAPRQLQVAMRFNPFMVCGFPALLLRQPYIVKTLSTSVDSPSKDVLNSIHEDAAKNHAPSHFVGMVGSVSHSVDQSGGTTTVMMHSVRRHQGVDDDYLDLLKEPVNTNQAKRIKLSDVLGKNKGGKVDTRLFDLLVNATPQVTPAEASASKKITSRGTNKATVTARKKVVNRKTGVVQFETSNVMARSRTSESTRSPTSDAPKTDTVGGRNVAAPNAYTRVGGIEGLKGTCLVPTPAGNICPGSKNGFFSEQGGVVLGVEVINPKVSTIDGKKVFEEIILHERLPASFEQRKQPIEEALRPPWFSSKYSNVNIGPKIYQSFFGCNSIIDDLKIQGLLETPVSDDKDKSSESQSVDPDKTPAQVAGEIVQHLNAQTDASVEKAVNILAFIYGRVRSQQMDVDAFVRAYIDRPIATKDEILGSEDLKIKVDPATKAAYAETGTLGFHSPAISKDLSDIGNLAGLIIDPDLRLPRINNFGATSPYNLRDIRTEKRDRVAAYVAALARGVGLRG